MKRLLIKAGRILYFFGIFDTIISNLKIIRAYIYTGYISRGFKQFGDSYISYKCRSIIGRERISVGNKTGFGNNLIIQVWKTYNAHEFDPTIIIGDSCTFGDDNQITSCNSITIGNNVLTGRNVLITDNSHGDSCRDSLLIHPVCRNLYSKGSVIIGDDVWICNNVVILPNVTIGEGCVIGANAVVTESVPPYTVVVGSSMKSISR